ncbi:MAG: hypothetical protein EBS90_05025, partial [Betaproteobacteria bacterium]|nr:hypothetical protein [Betaproteobacteria bacterium]
MLRLWSPGPVQGWLGVVMGLAFLAPSGAVAADAELVVPEVIPGVISAETIPDVVTGADVASARRFYVTGIVGSSFATLTDDLAGRYTDSSANGTLFTAGGALGMAFDRPFGAIRAEVEGRGRDSLEDSLAVTAIPLATGTGTWVAADSWSTMVNVWRDFSVTDNVDLYVGGGIGAGGSTYAVNGHYQLTGIAPDFFFGGPDTAQGFAWQAGCGTKWALSE